MKNLKDILTSRRLHVIIVEFGEININVIIYTEKVMCLNYKNVSNEVMAWDCLHKEFRVSRVTLSCSLFSLNKSISKIRHLSLLLRFPRIFKFARRFDGLKLCLCSKLPWFPDVYAHITRWSRWRHVQPIKFKNTIKSTLLEPALTLL